MKNNKQAAVAEPVPVAETVSLEQYNKLLAAVKALATADTCRWCDWCGNCGGGMEVHKAAAAKALAELGEV